MLATRPMLRIISDEDIIALLFIKQNEEINRAAENIIKT
jgi:hypothetical protein